MQPLHPEDFNNLSLAELIKAMTLYCQDYLKLSRQLFEDWETASEAARTKVRLKLPEDITPFLVEAVVLSHAGLEAAQAINNLPATYDGTQLRAQLTSTGQKLISMQPKLEALRQALD